MSDIMTEIVAICREGHERAVNWQDDLARREAEQSGDPEPHKLIECLFCGEIHTGDCAVTVAHPESYAAWVERNRDRMDAERDRPPGKW